jgi:hypothetical protein
MEPVDLIEKVADGFESGRYDWIQGNLSNASRTAFCMVGAMRYELIGTADGDKPLGAIRSVYMDARQAISEHLDRPSMGVPSWNDIAGRTKEQVIDKLKETAKDLRNQS